MTRPLVYVAGPITGDPWGCVRKATEAARALATDYRFDAYLPQDQRMKDHLFAAIVRLWGY